MSADWSLVSLDDLTDGSAITYGVVKPGEECTDGVRFVRGGDVIAGQIQVDRLRTISKEVSQQYSRTLLQGGELLVSLVGNPGEVALVPLSLKGANIARQVGLVRLDTHKVYPSYVQYFLRSRVGRELLLAHSKGSVQQVINLADLKSVKVPLPLKQVQIAVGNFMQNIDDRIALLRETNATLEAIAQALFKSWFVDFDPVHANAGTRPATLPPEMQALFPSTFTETPQGLVPEGWTVGCIADFANLNPESWTTKKHPETVAYIDLANAKDNVIADIAEFEFEAAPSRARRVLRDGDTIVGTVRPGNRSFAFIYDAVANLTGSTGFAVLRPKHPRNTAFVYLAATNDSSIEQLTHVADGGAYPAVRPEVVSSLDSVCPTDEILAAFNSVVAELLVKISKNHQQAQTLAALRDTLLPRLISGQLRLPEAEAELCKELP